MLANSWLHLSVLNLVTVQALGQHEKSGSVRNNEYGRRKGTRFVKHLLHCIRSVNLSSSQWLSEISKYFCPSGGSLRFIYFGSVGLGHTVVAFTFRYI